MKNIRSRNVTDISLCKHVLFLETLLDLVEKGFAFAFFLRFDVLKTAQQVFLLLRQVLRRLHFDVNVLIAVVGTPKVFDSLPFHFQDLTALRSFRNAEIHFPVYGRNFDHASKTGIDHVHRQIDVNIVSFPFEERIRRDVHFDIQVAVRSPVETPFALAADAQLLTVVDSGRNRDVDFRLRSLISLSRTGRTTVFDDLSAAAAGRTGALRFHRTENRLRSLTDGSGSFAVRAGDDVARTLRAGSAAGRTGFIEGNRHLDLFPFDGVHETDLDRNERIVSFDRTVPLSASSPGTATEERTENVAQIDVLKSALETVESVEPAGTAVRIECRETELVVTRLFIRVGKNLVSLLNFFEFFFGSGFLV